MNGIRYRWKLIIFLAILIWVGSSLAACSGAGPTVAHCPTHGRDTVLLYGQDFSDGLPKDWSFDGEWDVLQKDGNSVLYGKGEGQAVFLPGRWGETPISLTYRLVTLQEQFTSMLLYNAEKQGYPHLALTVMQGTSDRKDIPAVVKMELALATSPARGKVLGRAEELPYDPNLPYRIELAINPASIEVYFHPDDPGAYQEAKPVLVADLPTLPPGTIGFQTSRRSSLQVDAIQVCAAPYNFHGLARDVDTDKTLADIRVGVYGSARPYLEDPAGVTLLNTVLTDAEGAYHLEAPPGHNFYLVTTPQQPAYRVVAAKSELGVVVGETWVEYKSPPEPAEKSTDEFRLVALPTEVPTGSEGDNVPAPETPASPDDAPSVAATLPPPAMEPPPTPVTVVFAGQVLNAEDKQPLDGVELTVSGATGAYPDAGVPLISVKTEGGGWYKFEVPSGFPVYALQIGGERLFRVLDHTDRASKIRDERWVEYPAPPPNGYDFSDTLILEEILPAEQPQVTPVEIFTGQVMLLEDKKAVPGAVVQLSGAQGDYPDPGVSLGYTVTDEKGNFTLYTSEIYPFYSVSVANQPDLRVVYAESNNGKVREDWSISHVPAFQSAGGNLDYFYMQSPPTPTPTDTITPTQTDTPTLTPTDTIPPTDTPTWTATATQPAGAPPKEEIIPPINPDEEPPKRTGPGWLGTAAILLFLGTAGVLGAAAYLAYRFTRGRPPSGGRQPPDEPSRKPGIPPILPPMRLIDLWLSEGFSGQRTPLRPEQVLSTGGEYSLHVQLRQRGEPPAGQPPDGDKLPLRLVVYALPEDYEINPRSRPIEVPPQGSSEIYTQPIRPRRSGRLQLRACVYYGNLLLQSAVLDAPAGHAGGGPTIRQIDYVASASFVDLDRLAQPSLSLFTNQAADGSHWLGVYSAGLPEDSALRQGDVQRFPTAYLTGLAERARQALSRIQGEEVYRLKHTLPLDERAVQVHARDLVELARQGTLLYNELFGNDPDGSRGRERVLALRGLLEHPGLVSIARCRRDSISMPWGMLYTLPLRVEPDIPLQLCPLYQDQLRQNQWAPISGKLLQPFDRLEDPQGCLAQAGCPRKGEARFQTVCPFGFLGLLHEIEQPIQLVEPLATDQVPEKLQAQRFETRTRIIHNAGEPLRVGLGAYAGFRDLPQHHQSLQALSPQVQIEYAETREAVWSMIEAGGKHVLYFFCHGIVDQSNTFQLKVGRPEKPGYISASSLTPPMVLWLAEPHPLVVLNGCETSALKAEVLGVLMANLHLVGALGIVGSEIKLKTDLATAFGVLWMELILDGLPAGQAMLRLRRRLERQGNPLGLAYSLYAPTGLHLHESTGCPTCQAANRPPAATMNNPGRNP